MTDETRRRIAESKANLEGMARALQLILDGGTTQSAVARDNDMIPTELSRNVSRRFAPYVRKQLAAIDGLPKLVNAAMPAEDKLVMAILGVTAPEDAVLILPDVDCGAVDRMLGTLAPREEETVRLRFGLHGDCPDGPMALDATARRLNVTRERIRQIEAKALRKLRQPARARMLFRNVPVQDELIVEYSKAALEDAERTLAEARARYERAEAARAAAADLDRLSALVEAGDFEAADKLAPAVMEKHGLTGSEESGPRDVPVEEMGLSVRTCNCLLRAGVKTAADVAVLGREGLVRVRNLGRRGAEEIETAFLKATGRGLP